HQDLRGGAGRCPIAGARPSRPGSLRAGGAERLESASSQGDRPVSIGARFPKSDGVAKADGSGIYADDISLPRMLYAKILRSPHAHARIRAIDLGAALAHPGVVATLVGAELPAKYGVIPWTQDETALAVEKVRHVGAAVARETYRYAGSTHVPIEPHCAVARIDADGNLTVWSSTQIPHYVHRELSRVLGLQQSKVRVIQPLLGGAFGGKSDPFALEFCVAKLAMKTGRPVKILYTREEVFYAHRGRHPMKMDVTLTLDADGRISAVDNKILIDGGAYASFGLVTAYYAGQLLTGPYRFGT